MGGSQSGKEREDRPILVEVQKMKGAQKLGFSAEFRRERNAFQLESVSGALVVSQAPAHPAMVPHAGYQAPAGVT